MAWDPSRLDSATIDEYLENARRRWNELGLSRNGATPLDDEKACKILHSVNYSPKQAIKLIEHRLKKQIS
jgi:hypothetical protein